jgi:hypothetical protein
MNDAVVIAAISGWMRQIKNGRHPGICAMALVAGHPLEQSSVVGWVGMTGNASSGENGKDSIGMAFCTCQPGMRTGQREFRQCMIKCGGQPALRCVAGAASAPKLAFVGVILGMAPGAILRGGLQVGNVSGSTMARSTVQ